MTRSRVEAPASRPPLRLWPGVVLAVLLGLGRFGLPAVAPGAMPVAMIVGAVGGLAIVVWWAFFSRAPRLERWGALGLLIVVLLATPVLLHESIRTAGMGVLFFIYAVPAMALALVVGAAAGRRLAATPRRATLAAALLLAGGAWTLLRADGITGEGAAELAWRWRRTAEQRLLARAEGEASARAPAAADPAAAAGWPGFRGPGRDGIAAGARIGTDWTAAPPVELWRRPVGPGASSFAIHGALLYTQEQRGDAELVSCYDLATGEPVWRHRDAVRFWDSHVGAGPRATPALSGGRVYALGATGLLNALDAADGSLLWSRNAAADAGVEAPEWGFAGSPLVVDGVVVAAVAGRLAAYDLATGEPRWLGPEGGEGYSSPHLLTLDGVPQVLLLSEAGATSVAPADGALLWRHPGPGLSIVQPALTPDGDLLIAEVEARATGIRRLAVARGPGGWAVEERWTSARLKPYFSDFVVHAGHAYGFDGSILAAIDLADGSRRWKGGRYGSGQLVLLPEQELLVVVSERGELALVRATPERFTELARRPALTGKTWNHPVVVGDLLLLRNREEMAAFRLPPEAG